MPFLERDLGGLTPAARFRKALAAVDELIYAEIADRRGATTASRGTTCSRCCSRRATRTARAMTDVELRDELMTLLTAGHETTATGLSWAFERLLRTPRVLERLTESLDDDDYVDAVVKETLRVRPVIVDVARKLTRDTEVAGCTLPAGTLVLPAIAVLHARPDLYEDPDEFRPERFLDGKPRVVRLDPVRRRRAALHRRVVRAGGDADGAARGAAARAPARAVAAARARASFGT